MHGWISKTVPPQKMDTADLQKTSSRPTTRLVWRDLLGVRSRDIITSLSNSCMPQFVHLCPFQGLPDKTMWGLLERFERKDDGAT